MRWLFLVGNISFFCISAMDSKPKVSDEQRRKELQKPHKYGKLKQDVKTAKSLIEAGKLEPAYQLLQGVYLHANTRFWVVSKKDGEPAMRFLSEDAREVELANRDYCDTKLWQCIVSQLGRLHLRVTDKKLRAQVSMLQALAAKNLASAHCETLILSENVELAWQADKLHDQFNEHTLADKIAICEEAVSTWPNNKAAKKELAELRARKKEEIGMMLERREELTGDKKK